MSHIQAPEKPLPLQQGAGSALRTGLGFAHVIDGAGLSLLAPTVPRAMEYDIVLCYLHSEQLFQVALTYPHRQDPRTSISKTLLCCQHI